MLSRSVALAASSLLLTLSSRQALAGESSDPRSQPFELPRDAPAADKRDPATTKKPAATRDYLFPGGGTTSIAMATGIPFIAMSEVSVGVGRRFAIGGLAGIALSGSDGPRNTGFGIRPRVDVVELKDWRVAVNVPTLYYPIAKGSWFLTRPAVTLERKLKNGSYVGGGLGVVVVSTLAALEGKREGTWLPYGGRPGSHRADATNGIWNTVTLGGAVALSEKTHFFGDATLILRGLALPGEEWIGAVPFTLTAGITTTL